MSAAPKLLTLGWQEWVALPDLAIPALKAKVDTGARTSALHATDIVIVSSADGRPRVRFVVQPVPRRPVIRIPCEAPLIDTREVVSSNGESEHRHVIATRISIAGKSWTIEITLTDRGQMRARMLIGRQALAGHALIDPGSALLQPRLGLKGYRAKRSSD